MGPKRGVLHKIVNNNNFFYIFPCLFQVLSDLEINHLRRFSLTWELLSKHLYQVQAERERSMQWVNTNGCDLGNVANVAST